MSNGFEKNEVLDKLPAHLLDFVIDQPYNAYTAQDHAVWRYVMRQNVNFLGKVAHQSYLDGLKKTGISIDSIPHMYGMNRILKEIGWAAVAVDGFIPPQAFMEFQAYKVLVIAADIRNINHIQYTPAPDIIHEAAGHAPIIADDEYSKYLRRFGEVGAKAFSSKKDYELYEAIRHLSIIKEYPSTEPSAIKEAEERIDWLQENMGPASEMARIRNLHWWTVEYGLIGSLDNYKLYGAGLLSSIGESANCMKDKVKKLPYTIAAADYSFDITTEQPQLFVTPSFKHLNEVLDEFSQGMAFKKGGAYALDKALASGALSTLALPNGMEISGIPVKGSLKGDTLELHIEGQLGVFHNQAPLYVDQKEQMGVTRILVTEDQTPSASSNVIAGSEERCWFSTDHNTRTLHIKSPGQVSSAYPGPSNPKAWGLHFDPPKEKTQKIIHTDTAKQLHQKYQQLRDIREKEQNHEELPQIFAWVQKHHPTDWLLPLEIYEMITTLDIYPELQVTIKQSLEQLKDHSAEYHTLISDGLNLVNNQFKLVHP